MPRKLAPDLWLFGTAVVLLSTGVVMVYSASAIVAADRFHDPYFFLKKQIFWALLGAACMWMAIRLDYRRLEGYVVPLLIFVGIPALTIIKVARMRASRLGSPAPDVTARLEALESGVQDVQRELAETQERLDFAERLLSKAREDRRP